ncbi:hypothetical protein SAMN05444146_0865 [Flavobacterium johnsoniae]|uniref:MG2 domain-containing protein n=1 Tax=Flavobacterium johnsoniae (strain ATCC 17061 / DSM 2064 / JCM 8514 / BCRC 14874 / CCUG 350202 / NBRC 14942 / NCIMB 11054 / UW101) TaxID=376686 RepID=A5FK07_FLAJ1|nr:hypothetical protein Fjoh_1434 [Flavobacterium johnsoniae UW101]OXE97792.1 hypothetical protein B0A63_16810 [Flavobacterium johnsoniae UW101]SHK23172.1 hypothetical protein SAMN05444146_0865 [Flavobacterium johnsoniae]
MDRLKHIILLFVLINTQLSSAQQTIAIDETVFVHTNATTLVSGETLLYKIYCLKSSDKTPSNISKVAYVELVDDSKKSVFKTKISLENAVGQGDYFIPTTLKTGSYKLIGYTNWMLNKPFSELFQLNINIVNPYKVDEKTSALNILANGSNTSSENSANENITFKLNKKIFTNREFVDLKIQSLNNSFRDGTYSLSVRKLDNIPTQNQISAVKFSSAVSYPIVIDLQKQDQKIILPELRGEIISGKITAKNNSDKIENLSIGLSIPGKSFAFEVVKTDRDGNFIFNVSKTFFTSNIIIQIIDEKANNYDVVINNAPEIDYSQISFEKDSKLSYTFKESLLERSISSQIENAYYHKKVDNIEKAPTSDAFYYPLAKEYILDDYTRFKTLKETITEVVVEVYSKQKDDKIYLHVNDPSIFPQLPESALVLVDGLYLENQNDLLTYNMKNVYKIEIIVGRYYVGAKSFNGLISFTTFDKDFKSTQTGSFIAKPTILRPQPKKIYNKVKYENTVDNERIPDFRNQLFWNPDVQLNQDSETSFYTSDLSGTFEIRLEGFTKSGIPVSIKENIEIQNTSAN